MGNQNKIKGNTQLTLKMEGQNGIFTTIQCLSQNKPGNLKGGWQSIMAKKIKYYGGVTSGAGTSYSSGAHEFTSSFEWGSCYSIFSSICMFCCSQFVLLYFFFWPLCCLFFIDIRFLIGPLVSSNSSSLQKENILEISKPFSNHFCEDVFYSLYLAKLLVKFNIKECLSLDLLNLLSICDFPFEIRWEKAGVTDFEKINPLIKSNTLIRYYTIIPNIPTDIKKCSKDNIDNINTESVRLHL